jgi:NhaP-type Na+/H+ or K+/H+ antiporter
MHRGDFFRNIGNVILLGVFGTIVAFTTFSLMTVGVANYIPMSMYRLDKDTGKYVESALDLKPPECLLFCSLMCSSDVVAAVSLVSFEEDPDLYSVVFGEGITNDAVSIILFTTVYRFVNGEAKVDGAAAWTITKDFTVLGFNSLMIGIVFAILSAYILKKFRVFSKNPVSEVMMIFCIGYLAYVTSEISKNSGIITLLTVGIVMGHYTWFNLSPMGKQASYTVFEFLGYIMEAFVFGYLGLTFFSYAQYEFSISFFFL